MAEAQSLRTPEVTLGQFPNIFEKGKPNDAGETFYEADLLFSPEAQKTQEYASLKAAMAAAVQEKWKGSPPGSLRNPFRAAGEKRRQKDNTQYYPDEQFAGWVMLHVKSKNEPGVVGTTAGPDGKPLRITDPSEIYAGVKARCTVNPFAYQVKGNAGVSFWLNNMQKLGDGEPLSGRASARDDFEPVGAAAASGDVDALFNN